MLEFMKMTSDLFNPSETNFYYLNLVVFYRYENDCRPETENEPNQTRPRKAGSIRSLLQTDLFSIFQSRSTLFTFSSLLSRQ